MAAPTPTLSTPKPQLTTLHIAHLPPDLGVHLALYDQLTNSRFLRKQLLDGNPEFEYAFLDARTILSSTHVLAAVFRAVNDMLAGRMKSKNVHSEVVVAMSSNNNISEAYRKFGISDSTRALLVVKISRDNSDTAAIEQQLEWAVQGQPLAFDDDNLARLADLAEIRKVYKLTPPSSSKKTKESSEDAMREEERRELEMAILGLLAVRGAT